MRSAISLSRMLVVLALGCGEPKVVGDGAAGGGGSSGAGGEPGSPATAPPVFNPPPPPAVTDAAPPPGSGEACAEEIQRAERVQVDVLLVIDASSSMSSGAGADTGPSKYSVVKNALIAFARDPGSAGLGLGLQFFPIPGNGSPCQINADCGYPFLTPNGQPVCEPVRACAGPGAGFPLRLCTRGGTGCAAGLTCVPLGRCSVSFLDCTAIGDPCPGGPVGDRCLGLGSACTATDEQLVCTPTAYEALAAPIANLPAPGLDLITRELNVRGASGTTPMRPAVEGAVNHLRKRLQAHPGRRGVLVVATDGVPSAGACTSNTIASVADLLAGARMAPGGIVSYVIGIATPATGTERTDLEQLATAGGSGQPFIISPTENLGQRFQETLNVIRGQSLPCEFVIPPSRAGGAIDFGKVNVRLKSATGEDEILYAGGADRCDPARGGWYYDVDPATGTPTRILTCPASCQRFKAEPNATVDIRYGCRTRVID